MEKIIDIDRKFLIEKILNDIGYKLNYSNFELVDKVINNTSKDINYIWEKIPVLKELLAHTKGYIGISNSQDRFKIKYDKESVSEFISKEFYEIVTKWSDKYKIELTFDFEKEVFYI